METWFVSDYHFKHANIIKYANRPFENAQEMDETIIKRHNEMVKPKDIVYFLGDFTFQKHWVVRDLLKRLNGNFIFIKGNHDWKWIFDLGVNFVDMVDIKVNKQPITLCHYPMLSWNKSCHGAWHLFGHCHGTLEGVGKSLDVGVDCWDFYPCSFEQIKELMEGK